MKNAETAEIPDKVDIIIGLLDGLSSKVAGRSALMTDLENNKPID